MTELRECPFCGGEVRLHAHAASVRCKQKGCRVKPHVTAATDEAAIAAWNRRTDDWQPIETAPEDRLVMVWASPRDDLPGFVTIAQWNEWAGWCVDELRDTTHWRPLPKGPGG